MTDSVLKNAKVPLSDIDCFAINAGPGSFTGVRIGVAALKGLVFSEEKNCIPVSTLESCTYNFKDLPGLQEYIICPAMDARRNQVYTALFEWKKGSVHRLMEDVAIPISELLERLQQYGRPVLLVGDGAELVRQAAELTDLKTELAPPHLRFQNAVSVAACAEAKLASGEKPVASDDILPIYLRAPQAERELKKRKEQQG